jgi:hypothetical protein
VYQIDGYHKHGWAEIHNTSDGWAEGAKSYILLDGWAEGVIQYIILDGWAEGVIQYIILDG